MFVEILCRRVRELREISVYSVGLVDDGGLPSTFLGETRGAAVGNPDLGQSQALGPEGGPALGDALRGSRCGRHDGTENSEGHGRDPALVSAIARGLVHLQMTAHGPVFGASGPRHLFGASGAGLGLCGG